jgi:hypothetical protein
MAKKMTITKEQQLKNHKKINREIELENMGGWTATHKVHKNKKKTIHRKRKHKNL